MKYISLLSTIATSNEKSTKLLRFFSELGLFLFLFYGWKYFFDLVIAKNENLFAADIAVIIGWVLLYFIFGMEKDRIRFANLRSFGRLFGFLLTYSLYFFLVRVITSTEINLSENIIFCFLLSNVIFLVRVLVRQFVREHLKKNLTKVFVYGSEFATVDLINVLTFSKKYKVVGVLDNVKRNSARTIAGLPIIAIEDVNIYASMKKCHLVVFPDKLTSASNAKAVEYLLTHTELSVCSAPTIDQGFEYERKLTEVDPNIILNNRKSSLDRKIIHNNLSGKVVLVTGGGGSIGGELCIQVLEANPSVLIVIELSEYALFELEQKLQKMMVTTKSKVRLKLVLGSIGDTYILNDVFQNYNIDFVYHAAAYKHVPLVEENIHAALENNIINTSRLALQSARFGVDRFVLISSDKAVRPTNVMGASKRLAEIVCQGIFMETDTIFSCVRFGNVIGSSGSVIPKFKEQINSGGPVTVTHPEVNRYFMSIPQAVSLVLNSGIMAKGNEVFLLEMGDAVKILDLAKNIIRHHGLKPVMRDTAETIMAEDEVNIVFTGLRPGEKLYEELLIAGEKIPTSHPRIYISKENLVSKHAADKMLEDIKFALQNEEVTTIKTLLQSLPIEYKPAQKKIRKTKKLLETNSQVTEMIPNTQKIEIADNNQFHMFLKRILIKLLHCYFLLTRPLTVGVRVLILNENDEVLLVRHSYVNGWYLPGGGVDHGETIFDAALREVVEETSLVLEGEIETLGILHNANVSRRDHVVFLATKITRCTPKTNSAEISDVCFFPSNNLPKDICPDTARYISQYVGEN